MKKIIFFLTLFFTIHQLNAQTWCPPGATWYYEYNRWAVFMGSDIGYFKYEYTGDTIINTINCKKINKYDKTFLADVLYMYSDSDRVYLYRFNHFFTLYDFSAGVGDTFVVPRRVDGAYSLSGSTLQTCDTTGVIRIDSIGTILINGEVLRYICVNPVLNSHWGYSSKIIEKIGPTSGNLSFFEPAKYDYSCLDFIEEPHESNSFRCYWDDNFIEYSLSSVPCDYAVSVSENTYTNNFNIYPNPSSNLLNIEYEHNKSEVIQFEIQNLLGQTVYLETLKTNIGEQTKTLDISSLQNGVYFIQLKNRDKTYSAKFIKQ